MEQAEEELLQLTRWLLRAIAERDWVTYCELCDPSLTAFEPESLGELVGGLDFHRFYFELPRPEHDVQTTMVNPQVRLMGDSAIVGYIRLEQARTGDDSAATLGYAETRIWQRIEGRWRHVHFHRSRLSHRFD